MASRDLFANQSITVGTRKWYTVPASIVAHVLMVGAVVVVPLLATDLLPTPQSVLAFAVATPTPPPPPPPPPAVPRPSPPRASTVPPSAVDALLPPVEAPTGIASEAPPVPPALHVDLGARDLRGRAEVFTTLPSAPPQVVRVGGAIQAPRKIKDVVPLYPSVARAARVQGTVIIEATIDRQGAVKDTKILRSAPLPMLDEAATTAVSQWKYTPTTLNGVPVEVLMVITVQFTF